jgi:hypothetical protein
MLITTKDLKLIGPKGYDDAIRDLRDPLLKALDTYRINVSDGTEHETVADKEEIQNWKQQLLKLDPKGLFVIPNRVFYYIERKDKERYIGE